MFNLLFQPYGKFSAQFGTHAWWHHTWLDAPGSLSSRLRQLGELQVHVQYQGHQKLKLCEQCALGMSSGYVREVILTVNGQAVVWARSCTAQSNLRGAWKALKGLGSRALAELLFGDSHVRRGQLHVVAWHHHGRLEARAKRQWEQHHTKVLPTALPKYARASVFWYKGQPLHVMEVFSPCLSQWKYPA